MKRTTERLWYVAKTQFKPLWDVNKRADFFIDRGALLECKLGTMSSSINGYEKPTRLWLEAYGKDLDVRETLDGNGPLSMGNLFWGPYGADDVMSGLWYFRGQVGPQAQDVALMRAGFLERMDVMNPGRGDKSVKDNLLADGSFLDVILGRNCLTKRDGKICVATVLKFKENLSE